MEEIYFSLGAVVDSIIVGERVSIFWFVVRWNTAVAAGHNIFPEISGGPEFIGELKTAGIQVHVIYKGWNVGNLFWTLSTPKLSPE